MQDIVKDRVHQYLYQFYYPLNSDILLGELEALIRKKDDDYKLDILFIERILEERGLLKDIDRTYKDVADNKIIYKVDFNGLLKGYKAIFLRANRGTILFAFGGSIIYFALCFLLPDSGLIYGIITLLSISSIAYAVWIISEPILSCFFLPVLRLIINIPLGFLELFSDFVNEITGSLKKWSLFYDKEKNKPLIAKRRKLERTDIVIIESIFDKNDLTEEQAQIYLNSLLSIKNNISNNEL